MSHRIAPKLLAEFIGTFALVFIGAGAAAVVGTGAGLNGIAAIAFAHGLTIMAFAFAYGTISGGHMNPAVTVGVLAAGAMRPGEAVGYIVSQLAGGIAGALLLRAVLGGAATGLGMPQLAHGLVLGATSLTITPAAGFVIEATLANARPMESPESGSLSAITRLVSRYARQSSQPRPSERATPTPMR